MAYAIGLDYGTNSVRCLIVNTADGREYPAAIWNYATGQAAIILDPADHNVLYAAGWESSAWRSADRGNTWRRIRGYNFKHGQRVAPDPLDRSKIYVTTFGSSVWHGP